MFWNISFRITVTIFPRQFWFCKFLFSLFFILLVNVSRAHQTSVISTGSNLDSCLFSTFLFQLPLRAPFYRTFLPHLLVAVSSCSFSLHDFFPLFLRILLFINFFLIFLFGLFFTFSFSIQVFFTFDFSFSLVSYVFILFLLHFWVLLFCILCFFTFVFFHLYVLWLFLFFLSGFYIAV